MTNFLAVHLAILTQPKARWLHQVLQCNESAYLGKSITKLTIRMHQLMAKNPNLPIQNVNGFVGLYFPRPGTVHSESQMFSHIREFVSNEVAYSAKTPVEIKRHQDIIHTLLNMGNNGTDKRGLQKAAFREGRFFVESQDKSFNLVLHRDLVQSLAPELCSPLPKKAPYQPIISLDF